ncbi:MAG: type II/IV secretion system protein [Bacteroidetes bacterium]|nr:type II/IV secretion system protein [Bacteroidota bacterium]
MTETDHISLTIELKQVLTTGQAWHYNIIPKSVEGNTIVFYADEELYSASSKDELEILLEKNIQIEKIPSSLVQKALGKYYLKNTAGNGIEKSRKIAVGQSEDFLQSLIKEAKQLHSSDIHIEVYEQKCRVRMRIDGMLIERYTIDKSEYPSLINKVKIKANLDIAEKRLPQDGRIFFSSEDGKFDIRVSILPTLHGEKIVLRLLNNDAANIDINQLGFSDIELSYFLEGVKKPHGILLISGPTGSGKTTTLYATLKLLNKEKTNILTVEDPIEYTLEGVNQVQLKEEIGLTFASALRTFLRQDPDIIMLGEIRDGETAQMAIRAALTGHLVLSTIHTNSAWGTISRLSDMGVPPFLIASTLNTTAAQRLVRLLCPHCKKQEAFDEAWYPRVYKAPEKVTEHFTAQGCENCHHTGYKGRKAIYEVIPVDFELAEHIKKNSTNITEYLQQKGIKTLSENAFNLFKNGDTSIDEVYPILSNTN